MAGKTKVYTYTRVSTSMQVDGFSLDAQNDRMQKYADFMDYEIVGRYEDAGKSGKSIEGRLDFQRMMDDIASNKDNISYVLVFKLSRFGRNAADVLSSLQFMQDYGVNLISVEDGMDSSKDAGKLIITVLSAVAEIERENILVQTMEGRKQKAREGKWNGGFAPYGYKLVNGKLEIVEDEAEAVRIIYNLYANTEMGSNGVAKHLQLQGIQKKARQNGTNTMFSAHLVRMILDNPVYCGKIAFGRRSNQKVKGTRNQYHIVKQDEYLVSEGVHEAIVDEELWNLAHEKRMAQAKKYEHVNKGKNRTHLLSGILRCPVCGAGMYGNKSIKHINGKKYETFFYGCKHRTMVRGHACTYRRQINEGKLDAAVAEIISKMVGNPKFASVMQSKINLKVDTESIDKEIANYKKQCTQYIGTKKSLEKQMDSLDVLDKHYDRKMSDLQKRLDKMYDCISEVEDKLEDAKTRKRVIEKEKLSGDNIYKLLMHFDKVYDTMDDEDRRALLVALVKEIQIYEEEQANGQWLKTIKFNLPLIEEGMVFGLDNDEHIETVVLLSHKKPDGHINVKVEFGEGEGKVPLDNIAKRAESYKPKERVTYKMIKEYIEAKYGFKVHTAYIAEVKRDLGLPMYDAPNAVEELKQPRKHPTAEKVEAIKDALRYFGQA